MFFYLFSMQITKKVKMELTIRKIMKFLLKLS